MNGLGYCIFALDLSVEFLAKKTEYYILKNYSSSQSIKTRLTERRGNILRINHHKNKKIAYLKLVLRVSNSLKLLVFFKEIK